MRCIINRLRHKELAQAVSSVRQNLRVAKAHAQAEKDQELAVVSCYV